MKLLSYDDFLAVYSAAMERMDKSDQVHDLNIIQAKFNPATDTESWSKLLQAIYEASVHESIAILDRRMRAYHVWLQAQFEAIPTQGEGNQNSDLE